MWQTAFVAMSVTLGESVDDALAALGDHASAAGALAQRLRSESRETRARALAEHLAPIAADIEATEATWHG
jgi:hypothetical protein